MIQKVYMQMEEAPLCMTLSHGVEHIIRNGIGDIESQDLQRGCSPGRYKIQKGKGLGGGEFATRQLQRLKSKGINVGKQVLRFNVPKV